MVPPGFLASHGGDSAHHEMLPHPGSVLGMTQRQGRLLGHTEDIYKGLISPSTV